MTPEKGLPIEMQDPGKNRHAGGSSRGSRWAVVLTLMCAASACGGDAPGDDGDGRIQVTATTGMIADIAERVGGDRVAVTGLMGPGVDPHLYKASAGDVRTLSTSEVIFYNGLHLEAAMSEVLEQMDGTTRTVAVTDGIEPANLLTPPEFDGLYDPHVWFDVTMWISAVERIGQALADHDPPHASAYAARAAEVVTELEELDRWVRDQIEQLPPSRRVLVTAHDAFNYFGRAYGVEVRGLMGINTATEAGTADVQDLATFIVDNGIPALFVETSVPRRTVEAVQAAVEARGVSVSIGGSLFSDAMGNPGTPEGTYVGMVRHNVTTFVRAMSGPEE